MLSRTEGLTFCIKVAQVILIALVVVLCAIETHIFFEYTGAFPHMSVDDALGNISYSVAKKLRTAYYASPILGTGSFTIERMNGLISHGPFYYWIGGIISWLFGFSFPLMRSVHLFSVIGAIVMGFALWRGFFGSIAASLFALGAMFIMQEVHWVMIRPDISVAFFALCNCFFATLALKNGKKYNFFLWGLFASCTAFTHLVAWSILPACAITFFLYAYWAKRKQLQTWASLRGHLLWLGCGVSMCIFLYYWSMEFRIEENIRFLMSYFLYADRDHSGFHFFQTIMTHFNFAFFFIVESQSRMILFLLTCLLLGALLVSLLFFAKLSNRLKTNIITYVIPSFIVLGLYTVSLGFYKNTHTGYVILVQMGVLWLTASLFYVIFQETSRLPFTVRQVLYCVTALGVALLLGHRCYKELRSEHWRVTAARQYVNYSKYLSKVFDEIPPGARVLGSVILGLESPDRRDLVAITDAVVMLGMLPLDKVSQFLPDYIAWGPVEEKTNTIQTLRYNHTLYSRLGKFFPLKEFELESLIYAYPYNSTRILRRVNGSRLNRAPVVHIYDSKNSVWTSRLSEPFAVDIQTSDPVTFDLIGLSGTKLQNPSHSVTTNLTAGYYLLHVSLENNCIGDRGGMTVVATSSHAIHEVLQDYGVSFDTVPYSPSQSRVTLMLAHNGGPAYISLFDENKDVKILDIFVQRAVFPYEDSSFVIGSQEAISSAHFNWTMVNGVSLDKVNSDQVYTADISHLGYQLISQCISVLPGRVYSLTLPISQLQGQVGVGVLTPQETWLVSPSTLQMNKLTFNSGQNTSLRFVVANNQPDKTTRSRFMLGAGSLVLHRDKAYADEWVQALLNEKVLGVPRHPNGTSAEK